MQIEPIARFRSPLTTKFGIPRQGGLARSLSGRIVFEPPYRHDEAVRGLEQFSHLWIIWEFSANPHQAVGLTVRPPRLGGNERVGVFASRSPFRPNPLGLTCAQIVRVEHDPVLGPVIHVSGADLMNGTPIYDIKPYLPYADCRPEATGGFTDRTEKRTVEVVIPEQAARGMAAEDLEALKAVLREDPRPAYQDDPERTYAFEFGGRHVEFLVKDGILEVTAIR